MEKVLLLGGYNGFLLEISRELRACGYKICHVMGYCEFLREEFLQEFEAVYETDFSDLNALSQTMRKIREEQEGFDAIVNCISYISPNALLSKQGLELNFAINYMALFYIFIRWEKLIRPNGRFLSVSGSQYRSADPDLNSFRLETPFNMQREFARSELARALFITEFTRRKAGSAVVVAVNPGYPFLVSCRLFGDDFSPFVYGYYPKVVSRAMAADQNEVHGKLCRINKSGKFKITGFDTGLYSRAYGELLWDITQGIIEGIAL